MVPSNVVAVAPVTGGDHVVEAERLGQAAAPGRTGVVVASTSARPAAAVLGELDVGVGQHRSTSSRRGQSAARRPGSIGQPLASRTPWRVNNIVG